jgi:hypothetical protein
MVFLVSVLQRGYIALVIYLSIRPAVQCKQYSRHKKGHRVKL